MWKTNFAVTHRLTQVFIGQAIFTVEIFLSLRRESCRENVNREDFALFQMAFLCGKVHFMGTQVGVCSGIVSHGIECESIRSIFQVWHLPQTAPHLVKTFRMCKWCEMMRLKVRLEGHWQLESAPPPNPSHSPPNINNWTTRMKTFCWEVSTRN